MTDSLKLTAHFAERERAGDRFLAEALLDLFAERRVATAIMLRGIASFGPRNIVRTDQSLSLSEDPPVLISAVDDPAVISTVVTDAAALMSRGLLTLERARTVAGELIADLEADTDAVQLTLYLGRHDRVGRRPSHELACEVFRRLGFASATALLGVDGAVDGQRRRARFFSRNTDVPVMVTAIGTPAQAGAASTELAALLGNPLLTVERIQLCKRDGRLLAPPQEPRADMPFEKLTVLSYEDSRYRGTPIHRALVRRLRETHQVSGATAIRGLWGFHGDHPPRGDTMFRLARRVPVATMVIDTPEVIAHCFGIVDELTGEHGLVTCERVPAALAIDGAHRRGHTRLDRG